MLTAHADRLRIIEMRIGRTAPLESLERESGEETVAQSFAERVEGLEERELADDQQRVSRSVTIVQSLGARVESLEHQLARVREWTDEEFRRRLQHVAPWPLQQLYCFDMTLRPEFWRNTLKLSEDDLANAKTWAGPVCPLPRRVWIERWRSHTVIRCYGDRGDPAHPPTVLSAMNPGLVVLGRMDFPGDDRWLELYVEHGRLRLGFVGKPFGHGFRDYPSGGPHHGPSKAGTFIDLPMGLPNNLELQPFKVSREEPDEGEPVNLEPCEPDYLSEYWHADGATGVTWSLTVEDLRATHEGEIADL